MTLEQIETSCPCIAVGRLPLQIGPRETQTLTVRLDSSLDGEPAGNLGVNVTGYLSDGTVAFRTQVKIYESLGLEDRE